LKCNKDLAIRIKWNQKELLSKTEELARIEQQYKEAADQYNVMLKEVGVCPICNRSTVDSCVQ